MNQFAPMIIMIAILLVGATIAATAAVCTVTDELRFRGAGILFWFAATLFPLLLATWARGWGFIIAMTMYIVIVIAPAGVITMLSLFDIKRKEASKR